MTRPYRQQEQYPYFHAIPPKKLLANRPPVPLGVGMRMRFNLMLLLKKRRGMADNK